MTTNPADIHNNAIEIAAMVADELAMPSNFQLAAGEMNLEERLCVAAVANLIARSIRALAIKNVVPSNCPHCAYDRFFPPLEKGGWLQQDNNGPIVPCPVCNPNGDFARE